MVTRAALCIGLLVAAGCGPAAEVALDSPFDPANAEADFDGDGLTNGEERILGTDRLLSDSDDDGIPDGEDSCPVGPTSCIDLPPNGPDPADGGDEDGGELIGPGDGGSADGGDDGQGGEHGDDDDGGGDGELQPGEGDDGGVGDDGPGDDGLGGDGTGDDDGSDGDGGEDCVPSPELCNEVDDDCDGVVDPGCNGCTGDQQLSAGWVCVPATGIGTTVLGSDEHQPGRDDDERARHVRLTHAFLIQTTEVTRDDWADRMLPREFSDAGARAGLPVDGVSWYDALTYANALSRQEGLQPCYQLSGCRVEQGGVLDCSDWEWADGPDCEGHRLPTEAEWEYAARAETSFDEAALEDQAWCGTGGDADPEVVQPVRGRTPNPWGLYDMIGNVAEWVFDAYLRHPEPTSVDPFERGLPNEGRVLRGGSVGNGWDSCRPAARDLDVPDSPDPARGFRLVRTAD